MINFESPQNHDATAHAHAGSLMSHAQRIMSTALAPPTQKREKEGLVYTSPGPSLLPA